MAGHELLLGIDLGTTGVKIGSFDLRGRDAHVVRVAYSTSRPHRGWVEQDPAAWWNACVAAVRQLAEQIDVRQLGGMCVTGLTPTLVCTRENGNMVRPAPIWSDDRARAEELELRERLGHHPDSF